MSTFIAFVSILIDFLSLSIFGWFCALAIIFFGFTFFWSLFHKHSR